ncbi:MAG TPA: histidine kinase [Longimicrobiales bacterium]
MAETERAASPVSPRTMVAGALGLAAVLACLEAAQVYIGMSQLGYDLTWKWAIVSTLPSWVILAVLLAPTALLVARFPLERRTLPIALPVHVAAATLFTVLHLAGTAYFATMLEPIGYLDHFVRLAAQYFTLDVLTYLAIVAAFQLVRVYRREVRRERLAAELAATLSQLRFHALRNQLDPHFIFNALNAINAMALRGEREELVQTVGSLASLLRESFRETVPQLVPLDVELRYVADYLALQTIRFPNRLRVETAVSSEAGRALVPALTLHAIVEEAVTRRMRQPHPSRLVLLGARRENALHVEVMLDGSPHEDESALDEPIQALDARLRQLYGSEYGLTRTRTAERTAIRLRIPAG